MNGWQTLLYKEILRFWKVAFQTIAGPVLTAMLYLLIFGHALEDHVKVYDQVSYTAFLVPGLATSQRRAFSSGAECLRRTIYAREHQGERGSDIRPNHRRLCRHVPLLDGPIPFHRRG